VSVLTEEQIAARRRRIDAVRARMSEEGVDGLLLSHGADLPWLTGYEAMPLERPTVLVLPVSGDPALIVPALEAPRVKEAPGLFDLVPWTDVEDPLELGAARLPGGPDRVLAISDRAWAATVLSLQSLLSGATWRPASGVTAPLRSVKDAGERDALRGAGAAADRVARALQAGEIPLVGRTEAEVSADIGERLLAEGHSRVNFAIVGSGPHAASPHHEAGPRVIERGETVVCDFGGAYSLDGEVGYCSDITRTVVTGPVPPEVTESYDVLLAAQQDAVAAARAGVSAEHVDAVARTVIDEAGFGHLFIHRTGHGIGIEEHEDPYLVAGNAELLRPGHAFSVEPGIYWPGRFGMRLEDIVIVGDDGLPEPLNTVDHHLVSVDG
jgi:Xaa-Pro aminopeptidase